MSKLVNPVSSLVRRLMQLWAMGLLIGYQHGLPSLERSRIRAANGLAMVMLLTITTFLIILFLTGMSNWYHILPGFPIYVIGMLINGRNHHDKARYFLFFGSVFLILFWCLTNRRVGAEYGLMAAACSAPLTFKTKSAVFAAALFTALMFVVYRYMDAVLPFQPNPSVNYPVLSMAVFLASGMVIIFQLMGFRDSVHHYFVALNKSHQDLQTALEGKQSAEEELRIRHEEQRKLSEQLDWIVKQKTAELQTYLDAINVNINSAIINPTGHFVKVNEPLSKATGYSPEELIGQHFSLLGGGGGTRSIDSEMERAMLEGNTWRGEVKHKARDGSPYWTDQVMLPIKGKGDKVNYFLILALPITERKLNEEAREKTLRVLENIAYRTSHKIRGPLARVEGLVHLVQEDMIKMDEVKQIAVNLQVCSSELNLATKDLVEFVNENQRKM